MEASFLRKKFERLARLDSSSKPEENTSTGQRIRRLQVARNRG
jgi:hypothetical protein